MIELRTNPLGASSSRDTLFEASQRSCNTSQPTNVVEATFYTAYADPLTP